MAIKSRRNVVKSVEERKEEGGGEREEKAIRMAERADG